MAYLKGHFDSLECQRRGFHTVFAESRHLGGGYDTNVHIRLHAYKRELTRKASCDRCTSARKIFGQRHMKQFQVHTFVYLFL